MEHSTDMQIFKTICNLCHERCGMNAYVENGKISAISGMREHFSHRLCPKGFTSAEFIYSKDRLTNPLKREGDSFHEISWDEAFSYISENLIGIKDKYGPQAMVAHLGVPFVNSHTEYMARRFCDLYGTPNYTSGASFCFLARTIAHVLTFGGRAIPNWIDSLRTGCILVWGNNLVESNDPFPAYRLNEFLKGGTKLIVVDPRSTELAKKADIHAQIRPGTDGALALGMLNVIIEENIYDRDFVERWTSGFDALVEHVKRYPPEKVQQITWVQSDLVREMARTYALNGPGQILQGISMDHCTNGIQSLRAIAILTAITGNLDIPGGEVFTPSLRLANLRMEDCVSKESPGIGNCYPIFSRIVREEQASPIIEQMITEHPYPIKALLVDGCNPALTWPNTNKFKKARDRLELFVVIDVFMTDSGKMADIVLPGTSFLERDRIKDYATRGLSMAALANQVVNPVGNSMLDWKIWSELGRRMGYEQYFDWETTDELFEFLLEPTTISLDQLKRSPSGVYYAKREFRKYAKEGFFNTPSKKVEIFSRTLEDYGYDPLPTYHEPSESPVSRQDITDAYPFLFVGGPKKVYYTHSQQRNFPELRSCVPEAQVEINPLAAVKFGIEDGDTVQIDSLRGSIEAKAKLTKDIHTRVLSMEHGWSEANVNVLTNDESCDPISGFPGFRSVLCSIRKVN